MTRLLPAARTLLLGGLLTCPAQGQAGGGAALARALGLLPQEYTLTEDLPDLGLRVPGGAVRLAAPRPLKTLKASELTFAQDRLPTLFGVQCTAPLDLRVAPSAGGLRAEAQVDRWTRETTARVLYRSRTDAAFLSGREDAPVLTTVRLGQGEGLATLIVTSCPVRDSPGGMTPWSPLVQFADPPTLVALDRLGALAWCRPGTRDPVHNVQAYEGSVQLATRSRDGSLVATVGWDRGGPVLKVWRSQDARMLSRTPLKELPGNLSFTEDGRGVALLARTEGTQSVHVVTRVDAASGREEARLELPAGEHAVVVSGDGRRVATTRIDRTRTLRVREVVGGREVWSANGFQASVFAFARGDGWLGGSNEFGRLESWRAGDGQRGPETFVNVWAGTVLGPGVKAGELSVMLLEKTSGSDGTRWTVSSWAQGTPALTRRGVVSVKEGEGVVLHLGTGQPQVVPFCDVAQGLPSPLSGR